jgi:hypothetical protein
MRMRRARYLAGDEASSEADSARDRMCGPAIPTQTCAPARHAGPSTNDCKDHPALIIAAWRTRSQYSAVWCYYRVGGRQWWPSRGREARLRRQDKSAAVGRAHRIELIGIFRLRTNGAAVAFWQKASNSNVSGAVAGISTREHGAGKAATTGARRQAHRAPLPGVAPSGITAAN